MNDECDKKKRASAMITYVPAIPANPNEMQTGQTKLATKPKWRKGKGIDMKRSGRWREGRKLNMENSILEIIQHISS